ncbi:MAG: PilZ domain-containing protein [Gemmatales bacterium]|nr:PilZ domain-containing protein [Gemmatales bacterium]MDW7994367.1 PilZ domain-containing protein [Gemmatales bacterium]
MATLAAERKLVLHQGLRFESCLEENRLRAVWRAIGPDGKPRLVTYVKGFAVHPDSPVPTLAEERLTSIRHPYLLPVEAVIPEGGRLILITEAADCTWAEYFRTIPLEGPYGLRRQKLLTLLGQVAEALDFLRQEHALMHLGLSPRVLWLRNGQAAVSDYGVVELLWVPQRRPAAQYSPRYAAPEVFAGRPHWASDQFSLAVLYQELLTGSHPFHIGRLRDLSGESWQQPDLEPLPAKDREAVARALARRPEERFATCCELVRALREAPGRVESVSGPSPQLYVPGWQQDWRLHRSVSRLVGFASRGIEVREFRGMRYRYIAQGVLQHTCAAVLAPGLAWQKVMGFLSQWPTRLLQVDSFHIVVRITGQESWWQKVLPVVRDVFEVRLWFEPAWSSMTKVSIEIEYVGKYRQRQREILESFGPMFLEQLRSFLMATPERRQHERFEFHEPLLVCYGVSDSPGGNQLQVVGQDISSTGISFLAQQPLPEEQVQIIPFQDGRPGAVALPAHIVRVQPTPQGYLIAARFLTDPESPLEPNP